MINTIHKVKEFNKLASSYTESIDISEGRHVVNAASILGIFSLDLLNPVTVTIHTEDATRANDFFKEVEDILRG